MANNTDKLVKVLEDISQEINWDNWEDEGCKDQTAGKVYFTVLEVLYNKLESVKESLSEDDEEERDTIDSMIDICEALKSIPEVRDI